MNEIKGLVISSIDYKEKSKIVYLYTPYGHDSVKANHSKDLSKGLLAFTTTLNEVIYIKSNSKFPTLLEYNLVKTNFDLISTINNISIIGIILKIVQNIPSDSNHERVYSFLIETINNLYKYNPKKVLSIFLIKMTYVFGVNPILTYCNNCGNTDYISFFSVDFGASFCKTCDSRTNDYQIWREYYQEKKDISDYADTDFDDLLNNIKRYYQIHVNLNLK